MNSKERQRLRRFVRELEQIRGRHTELVSVYVPKDYDLNKIIQHLQSEQSTAKNIKDARTRSNVIDSLERCIRHLRLFKKTPENGLAVFAGNIAAQEGKVDIKIWSIEPPDPIKVRLYRCDQVFVLDILKSQMEYRDVYGLIVMDRREATIGLMKGTSIDVREHLTSGVPGKFKAGGQSSQRFERLIEGMAIEFYKRVAETCKKEFLNMKELKGILVGGPGQTKEDFIEYLNTEIKKKIKAVQDLTYTDESGLHDLVDKSKDIFAEEAIIEEKNIVNRFLTILGSESKRAVYGEENVRKAFEMGAVDILLISESLDDKKIEEFEDLAASYGSEVKIISNETREGKQIAQLGGVAAILRFALSVM